jgi:acyl-coenzyme A thioesterase PaaI-like protein
MGPGTLHKLTIGRGEMRKLPRYKHCFICGDKNECGTGVTWVQTADGIQGCYHCSEKHCGFEGVMHGGVLTGLLDECVGWAVALRNRTICFTGELTVRFLKPVPVDLEVQIRGKCSDDEAEGKKYLTGVGEIVDSDGSVYATCKAKFFPMPKKLEAAFMEKLELPEAPPGQSVADYLWQGSVDIHPHGDKHTLNHIPNGGQDGKDYLRKENRIAYVTLSRPDALTAGR